MGSKMSHIQIEVFKRVKCSRSIALDCLCTKSSANIMQVFFTKCISMLVFIRTELTQTRLMVTNDKLDDLIRTRCLHFQIKTLIFVVIDLYESKWWLDAEYGTGHYPKMMLIPVARVCGATDTLNYVNSLRPSDAYMQCWTVSSLVQMMACRLFGAKPLSEPMLEYC